MVQQLSGLSAWHAGLEGNNKVDELAEEGT